MAVIVSQAESPNNLFASHLGALPKGNVLRQNNGVKSGRATHNPPPFPEKKNPPRRSTEATPTRGKAVHGLKALMPLLSTDTYPTDYGHCRIIVLDFINKLYGDNTPVDDFTPRCPKLVREEMIQSHRFCRGVINGYTRRIVSIFVWGVENDLVPETIWRALKAVKSLPEGYPGTFDNEERHHK